MVQIDAAMCMGFGATLAVATAGKIAADPLQRYRIFLAGALVQGLVLTPLVVIYLARFPSWDTMYFLPDVMFHAKLLAVMAGGTFLSYFIGYHLAANWIINGRPTRALLLAGLCWLWTVAVPLILFDRFIHMGSTAQYQSGQKMGYIFFDLDFLLTTIIGGAALVFALWRLVIYIQKL